MGGAMKSILAKQAPHKQPVAADARTAGDADRRQKEIGKPAKHWPHDARRPYARRGGRRLKAQALLRRSA